MPFDAFDRAFELSFWKGLPVRLFEVPVDGLRDALPDFELRPFGQPPNDNPRMRMIVRMPHAQDQHERPVAAVSDRYDLLQHRVMALWLEANIGEAGLKDALAKVVMTEYGERIRITIPLGDRKRTLTDAATRSLFGEDEYEPEIEVTNSVDRSSAFRVVIRWRRLVCLNGMFTVEEDRIRSVHHVDLSRTKMVRDFMRERLAQEPDVLKQLLEWQTTKATKDDAQAWCEDYLREKTDWSVENCARLWAILERGYDGEVIPPRGRFERHSLSAYRVGQHRRVPGVNFPIQTAYDLAQLLTWITSKQRSVEMQLEGTEEVPRLMRSFLKRK